MRRLGATNCSRFLTKACVFFVPIDTGVSEEMSRTKTDSKQKEGVKKRGRRKKDEKNTRKEEEEEEEERTGRTRRTRNPLVEACRRLDCSPFPGPFLNRGSRS